MTAVGEIDALAALRQGASSIVRQLDLLTKLFNAAHLFSEESLDRLQQRAFVELALALRLVELDEGRLPIDYTALKTSIAKSQSDPSAEQLCQTLFELGKVASEHYRQIAVRASKLIRGAGPTLKDPALSGIHLPIWNFREMLNLVSREVRRTSMLFRAWCAFEPLLKSGVKAQAVAYSFETARAALIGAQEIPDVQIELAPLISQLEVASTDLSELAKRVAEAGEGLDGAILACHEGACALASSALNVLDGRPPLRPV